MRVTFFLAAISISSLLFGQTKTAIPLPSSKKLLLPVPGNPHVTSSFTETLALSPDGKYLAFLNNGFGSAASRLCQSVGIVDLKSGKLSEFADSRFAYKAQQSLFVGLAFSLDSRHLYASVGSLSDPTGKKQGNLGNGIAVYKVADGELRPERFIPIA